MCEERLPDLATDDERPREMVPPGCAASRSICSGPKQACGRPASGCRSTRTSCAPTSACSKARPSCTDSRRTPSAESCMTPCLLERLFLDQDVVAEADDRTPYMRKGPDQVIESSSGTKTILLADRWAGGASKSVMVGVAGFEPTASSSRTKRATKLRHTPVEPAQNSRAWRRDETGYRPAERRPGPALVREGGRQRAGQQRGTSVSGGEPASAAGDEGQQARLGPAGEPHRGGRARPDPGADVQERAVGVAAGPARDSLGLAPG